MMFEFADDVKRLTDIRVAGIGGAGGNAIARMIEAGLSGVEFLAMNTDLQALSDCRAHHPMQIGAVLTEGLGSGGRPEVGQAAAEEDREAIAKALGGANMVFVTAGMGGGTGTGAAPVVAEVARELGALTVGIVTKPFLFEGSVRMRQADEGIARMREAVDTLIVVPNQRLLEIVPPNTSMQEAFRIADNVLYEATRGIYEIISRHDSMNLDFADVCSVMTGMGEAMMGTGRAEGENRALEAAKEAISSPLLEDVDIHGSQAVLVNVLGREVELQETAVAMQFIQDTAGPQAHVIFGFGLDETLGDTLQVTVIATGFDTEGAPRRAVRPAAVQAAPVVAPPVVEDPEPEMAHPAAEVAAMEPAPVDASLVFAEPEPEPEPQTEAEAPAAQVIPLVQDIEETPAAVEPELDIPFEPEVMSEPAWPEAAQTAPEPLPTPEVEPFLTREAEPSEGFLTREAVGGGADQESQAEAVNPFLRPVGTRNIGEVEVPDSTDVPAPVSRSVSAGLGPDNPADNRSTPAYIRKYMD